VWVLADVAISEFEPMSSEDPNLFFLTQRILDKTTRRLIDHAIWSLSKEQLKKLRDDIDKLLVSKELDFCSMLNEQIKDEIGAGEAYRRLADLFEKEKERLVPAIINDADFTIARMRIQTIGEMEASHLVTLQGMKNSYCVVK